MANANPVCGRCGRKAIWIGIGPGAEPACSADCADKCPKCLTGPIEPFRIPEQVTYSWLGPVVTKPAEEAMRCWLYGHVFKEPK